MQRDGRGAERDAGEHADDDEGDGDEGGPRGDVDAVADPAE